MVAGGRRPRTGISGTGAGMTTDNFGQLLEGLRQHQPFRVFAVELHGGRRFEVDHPGASPTGSTVRVC